MRLARYPLYTGLCLLLALQACSNLPPSPSATVDYNHSYDFSHVHKIAIQPIARDSVATMLISDQQIHRINDALKQELLRRNFEVVTDNAEADMYLTWRFIYKDGGGSSSSDPDEPQTPEGTLYVNMIDPVMLQAQWRATFQSDLRDHPETPEAAQYRRRAAQVILARFPP